ncbi:MAG: hypothetical protein ACYDBB_26560 [Armatimonadota bacterium]
MRVLPILGWAGGIWVAAGVDFAFGNGLPGPLLLIALAAGLWSGTVAGLLVGCAAGLCAAAMTGHGAVLATFFCASGGALASLLPRWYSRRHLLIAMVLAGLVTGIITLLLGLVAHQPLSQLLRYTCWRSAANILWMIPIYGSIILLAPAGSRRNTSGE